MILKLTPKFCSSLLHVSWMCLGGFDVLGRHSPPTAIQFLLITLLCKNAFIIVCTSLQRAGSLLSVHGLLNVQNKEEVKEAENLA